jgi:hypothetical protein
MKPIAYMLRDKNNGKISFMEQEPLDHHFTTHFVTKLFTNIKKKKSSSYFADNKESVLGVVSNIMAHHDMRSTPMPKISIVDDRGGNTGCFIITEKPLE